MPAGYVRVVGGPGAGAPVAHARRPVHSTLMWIFLR
ncbi:hypothetical protein ABIB20_001667 [Micrococcus sp. UYEF12]